MDFAEGAVFAVMLGLIIFGTQLFEEREITGQITTQPQCVNPEIIAPMQAQVFTHTETIPVLVRSNPPSDLSIVNNRGETQKYNGPQEMKFKGMQAGIYRLDATNTCGKTSVAFVVK